MINVNLISNYLEPPMHLITANNKVARRRYTENDNIKKYKTNTTAWLPDIPYPYLLVPRRYVPYASEILTPS